jgi:hypothetical protein
MLNSLNAIINKTILMISEQNWIIKLSVAGLAMLAPLKMYIHFLILLLVVDLITSIYYQYRQNHMQLKQCKKVSHISQSRIKTLLLTIESSRLRITFEKLVAYITGIIVCFFFDTIILQITPLESGSLNYFSIANISVLLICSVELTSILSNLSKITKNPVYDTIIRIFTKKVNDKINSYGNDNNS